MSEVLPLPWLLQSSNYNVKIGEETVITTVADREAIGNSSISKLKDELKSDPNPFVGIDVVNNGDLLLLHVKKRCLIIQLRRLMVLDYKTVFPESLAQFLWDKTITFIGPRNISKKSTITYGSGGCSREFEIRRIVDVGYLTERIRKKPKLLSGTLEELLGEVGLDIKKP